MNVRLRLGLAVMAAASLTACASMRGSGSDHIRLESRATRALNAYIDCTYIHADAMAAGTQPAPDAADAAVASCGRHYSDYCFAAGEYLTSVAPAEERDLAGERAQTRCAETRTDTRDALIRRILKERELVAKRREQALAEALGRSPAPPADPAR